MKIIVGGFSSNIFVTDEEMKSQKLCNIGQGADTCIWLVVSPEGFECTCLNKSPILLSRLREGKTVAKKDGCDFVNNLEVCGVLGLGEHELTPEVY